MLQCGKKAKCTLAQGRTLHSSDVVIEAFENSTYIDTCQQLDEMSSKQ